MKNIRMELPSGTVLKNGQDTYKIVSKIGEGGSALIYRAEKTGEDGSIRMVTLKEIYPYSPDNLYIRDRDGRIFPVKAMKKEPNIPVTNHCMDALLQRLYIQLEKEEKIGQRLKDESFLVCNLKILKKMHLEESNQILFGFAEMMDMNRSGVVLSEIIKELSEEYEQKIPLKISLLILKQLALTMQKIHDSGFLYCDFSPENIFLLKDNMTAVFIDFGSALEKIRDCVESEDFIPSSYGYRAPEVAFRNHPGSEKSTLYESGDVFSLMTVFYRLVSGKRFAWTEEFFRALSPNDRIISWKRMKEIGIENPTEGLILNRMLLEGLQWDLDGRISNIRELLKYAEKLEQLMNKKGNLFETLRLLHQWGCSDINGILEGFFQTAVPEKRRIEGALESLSKELNGDYGSREICFAHHWLETWYERIRKREADWENTGERKRIELLLKYCGVAVYNHTGDYRKALENYQYCEERKEEIGISDYLNMRLRAAESYANSFQYCRAYQLVKENVAALSMRKECYRRIAARFDIQTETASKTVEMGKNLSAAGRYSSFLGAEEGEQRYHEAQKYFEEALKEFEEDGINRDRVYNYILQMAAAKKDRCLFDYYRTICIGEGSIEEQILHILKNPDRQGEYHLYVLLKAIRIFGANQAGEEFWKELCHLAKTVGSTEKERNHHPWELIFRQAAVLLAEKKGKVDGNVKALFLASRSVPAIGDSDAPFRNFTKKVMEADFNTILALHMFTLIQEYELCIRYASGEAERKKYQKKLENSMNHVISYFEEKCGRIVEPELWNSCRTAEKKYRLLEGKFTYEYA